MSTEAPAAARELTPTEAQSVIGGAFDFLEQQVGAPKTEPPKSEPKPEEIVEQKPGKALESPKEDAEPPKEEKAVDEPPGEKTPQAKTRWQELRQVEKEHQRILPEYEKLKAENEALRKNPESATIKQQLEEREKEIAEFRQREEEFEKKAMLLDVKSSKQYEASVRKPFEALCGEADTLAAEIKQDPDAFFEALQTKNKSKLQEMIAEQDEFTRNQVWDLLRNLTTIEKRKHEIESNHKGAYETMQREEKAAQEKQMREIMDRRGSEFDNLKGKFETILKDLPEDSRINVESIRKDALNIEQLPDNLKVYAGISAAVMPQMLEVIKNQSEELAELRTENASLRNGSPRTGAGTSPSAPAEQKQEKNFDSSEGLAGDILKKLQSVKY